MRAIIIVQPAGRRGHDGSGWLFGNAYLISLCPELPVIQEESVVGGTAMPPTVLRSAL